VKSKSPKFGLARALSKLGYCSRSHAAKLIRGGHVTLNGKVCLDPETPAGKQGQIAIDRKVVQAQEKIYWMMNKPRGIITTASDEKGRETVYTLLAKKKNSRDVAEPWVAPVGRLDKASEGLLLLTNDSEWAAHIAAPETHLDKTYHVQISRVVDGEFTQSLIRGVSTNEGELLRAKQAHILRSGEKNCWLEIVLDEGKNRQIRRMMEALSVEVLRLMRIAIGPLQLGELAKGKHRALTADEKRALDRSMKVKA
jgi:23S rRNA pseudouridine2605 synthase